MTILDDMYSFVDDNQIESNLMIMVNVSVYGCPRSDGCDYETDNDNNGNNNNCDEGNHNVWRA